jgi:hypothetical protein
MREALLNIINRTVASTNAWDREAHEIGGVGNLYNLVLHISARSQYEETNQWGRVVALNCRQQELLASRPFPHRALLDATRAQLSDLEHALAGVERRLA